MALLSMTLRMIGDWLWADESDYKWLALIVSVALAIRFAWVLLFQTPPTSDAAEYDSLAWRLANGEGYVTSDGTPTAFWPVGYPAFLAAVYTVFGHSWLAAGIANALLGTAGVALTYRLAREALPSRLSLVAAGTIAILPSHIISFTSVLRNEALHTVLVLAALIATCHLVRFPNWKNATLLGIVIGLGVYVRPILLLFPCVVLALLLIRGCNVTVRMAVGLVCIVMIVSLLTISPWTVRNFIVMDYPVLIATNVGKVFLTGNGPGATGEYRVIPINTFSDPSEITAYREGLRMGVEYILSEPAEWLSILPNKFFHIWASDRYNIAPSIVPETYRGIVPALWVVAQLYWTVIVLAFMASLFTRSPGGYWLKFPAILFLLTLTYWTAFHMMFHGEGRYHMQVVPVVAIVGVHLLARNRDWRSWLPQNTGLGSRLG